MCGPKSGRLKWTQMLCSLAKRSSLTRCLLELWVRHLITLDQHRYHQADEPK